MPALLLVFLGALLTLAAAFSLGRALTSWRVLSAALTFGIGAAALSLLIFFLRLSGHAGPRGMLALGITSALPLAWFRMGPLSLPRVPRIVAVIVAAYGLFYLVQALAPETRADANVYHLMPAVESLRTGEFGEEISFYERLPQGMESLFAMAYSVGGSSAAKLVHLALFFATFPLIVQIGRHLGASEEVSAIAAAIYLCTPVAGVSGTSAFTDAALVYYTAAAVLLLILWREERDNRLLLLAGAAAGFCYCCKITGALIPAFGAAYLLTSRKWKPPVLFAATALLMMAPWLVRNAIEVGNPLAPLANRFFPNPYFHIATEDLYAKSMRSYQGMSWLDVPLEITVGGERLQGVVGPVFLLIPLALLALRTRNGRIVLALAALLAVPWFFNMGTRFLMQSLPLAALAMAMSVPRAGAYALLLIQAIGCAPPLLEQYAPSYTELFPWRAALRLESEPHFLERVSWDYRLAKMIEANTKPSDRIFDLFGLPLAVLNREVVGTYQTALGDNLFTNFEVALLQDRGILYDQRASFPEQALQAIRVRQTATTTQLWSIHDLELFRGERNIGTSRRWTLDAWPNSWEAPLGLDQNLASRWRTWEPARPGMFFEVDFDRPETLTAINVVGRTTEYEPRLEIYGQRPDGVWVQFPAPRTVRPAINLRHAAVRMVRRSGMKYILAPGGKAGGGPIGTSMANQPFDWGVEIVAQLDNTYLLKIP
ncbi:MAG: glycosyltransferase family 39 protein [Bryobacteraceae bacterium]